MPIFIVKQDVSFGMTIEILLESHRNDLEHQEAFNCNYFSYWWDVDFTYFLTMVEAPNVAAIENLYNSLHKGSLPVINEIDKNITNNFLEKLVDPYHDIKFDNLDLKDSPEQTFLLIKSIRNPFDLKQNNDLEQQLNQKKIIKELINKYEGDFIEIDKNYVLSSFRSTTKSVLCAINTYKRLKKSKLSYKFTLNTGIFSIKNKRIFERTIKLNERFCDYFYKDIIISSRVNVLYTEVNNELLTEIPYIHIIKYSEEKFLTQFLDLLEDIWANPELRIEDFLIHLGLSKSQLNRKLNSLTGKSPNKFIKDYRLNKALDLLLTNKMSITEVAYAAGFSSPSYFTKCFQKTNKISPSEFCVN